MSLWRDIFWIAVMLAATAAICASGLRYSSNWGSVAFGPAAGSPSSVDAAAPGPRGPMHIPDAPSPRTAADDERPVTLARTPR